MKQKEQFNLVWNDFQLNISSSFKEMREDTDFADVTLSCEDNQQIMAHKVVLAAASPLFKTMFKHNKHSHPLIYLRGVKSKYLTNLVDFVYQGETKISQDDLAGFLALAGDLHIKGLETLNTEDKEEFESPKSNKTIKQYTEHKVIQHISHETKIEPLADVNLENYGTKIAVNNIEYLDNTIESIIEKSENKYKCTMCGKQMDKKHHMSNHIEANHIEGVRHPCTSCGEEKTYKTRQVLAHHISKKHKNMS